MAAKDNDDRKDADQDGDISLDMSQAAVKKMIADARERGYITYDQLNEVLPPDQVSSEQIEDVMSMLSEMGINIIEEEEAEDEEGKSTAVVETSSNRDVALSSGTAEKLDRTDDPVRMYLREMGTVPLLDREGEVEIARRLVREISSLAPDTPMTVTATTATGLDLARRGLPDEVPVVPCPLDLPGALGRFFDASRPRALVVVETELWPEMLHQAGSRAVPVAVVNGRLSDASFRRYRRVRPLIGPLLDPLSLVLARSPADAERFAALGVSPGAIRVAGNIKYDLEPDPEPLPWAAEVKSAAGGRPGRGRR